MFEVAQAIEYIHAEGVVHGDLKGVRILMPYLVNLFISFSARKIYFSIPSFAAKWLTLD